MTGEPGEPVIITVMKPFCNQNWGHSENHSEQMGNSKSKIVSGKMLELFQITICINSRYQQRGNIWYEKKIKAEKNMEIEGRLRNIIRKNMTVLFEF